LIYSILKKRALFFFQSKIRSPLLKFKERDIIHYDLRADYRQVLCLKDYDPNEMEKIFEMELVMEDKKKIYNEDESAVI